MTIRHPVGLRHPVHAHKHSLLRARSLARSLSHLLSLVQFVDVMAACAVYMHDTHAYTPSHSMAEMPADMVYSLYTQYYIQYLYITIRIHNIIHDMYESFIYRIIRITDIVCTENTNSHTHFLSSWKRWQRARCT